MLKEFPSILYERAGAHRLFVPVRTKRELKTLKSQRGTIGHFTSVIHTIRPRELGQPDALVTNQTIHSTVSDPNPERPVAAYQLNNDGNAEKFTGETNELIVWVSIAGQWLLLGSVNEFEAQFIDGGSSGAAFTNNGVTLGTTWHDLTFDQFHSITKDTTSNGQGNQIIDLTIREKLDVTNTTSATITLEAQYIV